MHDNNFSSKLILVIFFNIENFCCNNLIFLIIKFYLIFIFLGRATVLKEDGNEMFKRKKYRDAIDLYTEALAKKPSDTQLTAVLYCNRAAAHYYIGKNCYWWQL